MKKAIVFFTMGLVVLLTACGNHQKVSETAVTTTQPITTASTVPQETVQPTSTPVSTQPQTTATTPQQKQAQPEQEEVQSQVEEQPEKQNMTLQMTIGNTPVEVAWEENEAVQSLKELCRNEPLTIAMSMYGGFEQVGSIGTNLPANDVQTTTSAGDIVLYSGNQMVVFYGSNSWAYTRLGHITDQSADGMAQLLSGGDTTITITLE